MGNVLLRNFGTFLRSTRRRIPECLHCPENLRSREELFWGLQQQIPLKRRWIYIRRPQVNVRSVGTYLLSAFIPQRSWCCISALRQLRTCCYLQTGARHTEEIHALLILLSVFPAPPLIPASAGSACLNRMLMAAFTLWIDTCIQVESHLNPLETKYSHLTDRRSLCVGVRSPVWAEHSFYCFFY